MHTWHTQVHTHAYTCVLGLSEGDVLPWVPETTLRSKHYTYGSFPQALQTISCSRCLVRHSTLPLEASANKQKQTVSRLEGCKCYPLQAAVTIEAAEAGSRQHKRQWQKDKWNHEPRGWNLWTVEIESAAGGRLLYHLMAHQKQGCTKLVLKSTKSIKKHHTKNQVSLKNYLDYLIHS